MHSTKTEHRAASKIALGAVRTAVLFLVAIAAIGQEVSVRTSTRGTYPRVPGAVTKAPAGVGADAPFDVNAFFKAVPREKNAAPLYLDALFEFAADVEVCFPAGPERDRRTQAARDRAKQYADLVQTVGADSKLELDASAVDALIKLHDVGYRKLAGAQRLNQCVFETGFDIATLLPHAQVAREVCRISILKVQRAVQRGDIAAAIYEIELVLRLAKDLRPRGIVITQLVADACSQYICSVAVPTVLASPRLRAEQCERLMKVLETHDAKSVDGYAEGLRAAYLVARSTLESVVHDQSKLATSFGLKRGESVVRAVITGGAMSHAPGDDPKSGQPGGDWDQIVARATPAEVSRHTKEMTQFYRNLLDMSTLPFSRRIEKVTGLTAASGTDPLSLVVRGLEQPEGIEAVARAAARTLASLRAMECLVALKRWQISHRGLPKDLASVVKGVGLKTVPLDPYDGQPMKLTVIDGQPVVYSIGRDGIDQGGRVDCDRDIKPSGDLIYRLPALEERHQLRP